jgi:hypothetical protein
MYKMTKLLTDKEKVEKKYDIMTNIRSILFYSMSLSVALGFNDLVLTVFDSFPDTQHIISKTIYVIIMFGLTLVAAYWFSDPVKSPVVPPVSVNNQ